ncbi:MAG: octaprenyl diphosphate synthase [Arenicellales bacterium]|nr:octaprenyl diphosphate synthase [Arenicellales bacterium]MEE1558436.1 octaprenyl diphosphate synthase [Arenicellales bacterium]
MATVIPMPQSPRKSSGDTPTSLEQATALVADDLTAVNRHINNQLASDVSLIRQMGAYIIAAGGKRLRPLTLILSAHALSYQGTAHIDLAAVIEFIHTATLLHDDVVDESDLRRGRPTANAVWDNSATVLVGDFLYSRAFEMMVAVDRMRVMEIMAGTTNAIAEGEVMQLLNTHNPETTEEQYLETITRKTARLFESATRLGAVLAGAGPATEDALADFGLHLGVAFQIIDDALDYRADAKQMGKNAGDDLAEGKVTLPLIHALQHCDDSQGQLLRNAIEDGTREHFGRIHSIIETLDSLAYTSRRAQDHADAARQALEVLPPSNYRTALANLADFSVSRTF